MRPSEEELGRYLERVEPMIRKTCPMEGFCKSGYLHEGICSAQTVLRRLLKDGKISGRDVRGALGLRRVRKKGRRW